MGWWNTDPRGVSFSDGGLLWGDGPADIMSNALDKIEKEFLDAQGRRPSQAELKAGLLFSIGETNREKEAAQ